MEFYNEELLAENIRIQDQYELGFKKSIQITFPSILLGYYSALTSKFKKEFPDLKFHKGSAGLSTNTFVLPNAANISILCNQFINGTNYNELLPLDGIMTLIASSDYVKFYLNDLLIGMIYTTELPHISDFYPEYEVLIHLYEYLDIHLFPEHSGAVLDFDENEVQLFIEYLGIAPAKKQQGRKQHSVFGLVSAEPFIFVTGTWKLFHIYSVPLGQNLRYSFLSLLPLNETKIAMMNIYPHATLRVAKCKYFRGIKMTHLKLLNGDNVAPDLRNTVCANVYVPDGQNIIPMDEKNEVPLVFHLYITLCIYLQQKLPDEKNMEKYNILVANIKQVSAAILTDLLSTPVKITNIMGFSTPLRHTMSKRFVDTFGICSVVEAYNVTYPGAFQTTELFMTTNNGCDVPLLNYETLLGTNILATRDNIVTNEPDDYLPDDEKNLDNENQTFQNYNLKPIKITGAGIRQSIDKTNESFVDQTFNSITLYDS